MFQFMYGWQDRLTSLLKYYFIFIIIFGNIYMVSLIFIHYFSISKILEKKELVEL